MATSIDLLLLILLSGGGLGIPNGMPPAAENPVMHRIAPDDCLAYYSWAPAGSPKAANGNHTEALIADPEIQASINAIAEVIEKQFRRLSLSGDPAAVAFAEIGPGMIQSALTRAGAIYVRDIAKSPDDSDPMIRAGMLLHVGKDATAIRKGFEALQSNAPEGAVTAVTIGDHEFYLIQEDEKSLAFTWGVTNGYLLFAFGDDELHAMAARMTGEPPAWLTNIAKQLPLDRRASVAYLNVPKAIDAFAAFDEEGVSKEAIAASGFANVQSFVAVSGLDETGFVTRSQVNTEGALTGAFAMIGGAPLTAKDLATIPHDAQAAFALRVEPTTVFDQFLAIAKEFDAYAVKETEGDLGRFESTYEMKLRDDLLNSLGDSARIYASPQAGGLLTGWTAVIDLDDAETLRKFHDQVVTTAQKEFGEDYYAPKINFKEYASHRIYSIHLPDSEVFFTPSWCITKEHLVVGMFPQTVREFLSRGDEFQSLANVAEVKAELEADGELQMLAYVDTREAVKAIYPMAQVALRMGSANFLREEIDLDISLLPSASALNRHLQPTIGTVRRNKDGLEFVGKQTIPTVSIGSAAPVALSMTLPTIVNARRVAQRSASMNNLKQIGLGVHFFHDVWLAFPAAYSVDDDGKQLLSWRVHILPFIDQEELHSKFHLDEPWDSEHNLKLVALMPDVFKSPGVEIPAGKTVYLGNANEKHGIFVKPKKGSETSSGVGFRDVTDGTSYTIMAVEANPKAAITWTKPGDFDLEKMKREFLFGSRKEGAIALYADASSRMTPNAIPDRELEKLLQRNDGKVIDHSYEEFGQRSMIFGTLFGSSARTRMDEHMHDHMHEEFDEEMHEDDFDLSPDEDKMELPLEGIDVEIEFERLK